MKGNVNKNIVSTTYFSSVQTVVDEKKVIHAIMTMDIYPKPKMVKVSLSLNYS